MILWGVGELLFVCGSFNLRFMWMVREIKEKMCVCVGVWECEQFDEIEPEPLGEGGRLRV